MVILFYFTIAGNTERRQMKWSSNIVDSEYKCDVKYLVIATGTARWRMLIPSPLTATITPHTIKRRAGNLFTAISDIYQRTQAREYNLF